MVISKQSQSNGGVSWLSSCDNLSIRHHCLLAIYFLKICVCPNTGEVLPLASYGIFFLWEQRGDLNMLGFRGTPKNGDKLMRPSRYFVARTDVGINVMPRMSWKKGQIMVTSLVKQQPPLIASGDYAGFRENHGNLHSLIQPKNALKGKTVFFGPSVLMILIQSPLINKELVYTVVFLHPSQLKYTSVNMAMEQHPFVDDAIQTPLIQDFSSLPCFGLNLEVVPWGQWPCALPWASSTVVPGSSPRQMEIDGHPWGKCGVHPIFNRHPMDFFGPSSLKGNLGKLSNANVFFLQIFEQAGAVSSKPGLAEGCRSPDASFWAWWFPPSVVQGLLAHSQHSQHSQQAVRISWFQSTWVHIVLWRCDYLNVHVNSLNSLLSLHVPIYSRC